MGLKEQMKNFENKKGQLLIEVNQENGAERVQISGSVDDQQAMAILSSLTILLSRKLEVEPNKVLAMIGTNIMVNEMFKDAPDDLKNTFKDVLKDISKDLKDM